MLAAQLSYEFDPGQIAQFPLAERDSSRLMVLDRQECAVFHESFRNLPRLLRPGDLLVLNDAKVFPARLQGRRSTGGLVELLLTERIGDGDDAWLCLEGRASRVKVGEEVDFGEGLRGCWGAMAADGRRVVTLKAPGDLWATILAVGQMPLPPYIRRPPVEEDAARYQTVYARADGAVAAPTAGLHFTVSLLEALRAAGVGIEYLTLTVGLGTFLPIRVPELGRHRMRPETYSIPVPAAEAISETKARGGRVVAVGTTTTRALEGAALAHGEVRSGGGCTDIFIAPGHRFRAVDCMITNFHLPRSTPLALAMALGGVDLVKESYRVAVEERYRLYSYGDAMLIR